MVEWRVSPSVEVSFEYPRAYCGNERVQSEMTSNTIMNRLTIELACESLTRGRFSNVYHNKGQGTFPDVYVTAFDPSTGVDYLICVTGRVETKADGNWNDRFNLVGNVNDYRRATAMIKSNNKALAFVAIAYRKSDASYAAYFDRIYPPTLPRSIPMLPSDRRKKKYRELTPYTQDDRVRELLSS
jgi:hypothetical protein